MFQGNLQKSIQKGLEVGLLSLVGQQPPQFVRQNFDLNTEGDPSATTKDEKLGSFALADTEVLGMNTYLNNDQFDSNAKNPHMKFNQESSIEAYEQDLE